MLRVLAEFRSWWVLEELAWVFAYVLARAYSANTM